MIILFLILYETNILSTKYPVANRFSLYFNIDNQNFYIHVECRNTPTINRWYEATKSWYSNSKHMSYIDYIKGPGTLPRDIILIENLYNTLTRTFNQLDSMLLFNMFKPYSNTYTFDQQWCNKIHRYFTTLVKYRKFEIDGDEAYSEKNELTPLIFKKLHIINDLIHKLERYNFTPQRIKYKKQHCALLISPHNLSSSAIDGSDTNLKWHEFLEEDFQYHELITEYNVIFLSEILGKSLLQSFFDDDDPNYFDTSGHSGWYGGFEIILNDTRQKIYNSDDFNNWLSKHNIPEQNKKLKGDYPIGKVIDTNFDSNFDSNKFQNIKININEVNLVFHN